MIITNRLIVNSAPSELGDLEEIFDSLSLSFLPCKMGDRTSQALAGGEDDVGHESGQHTAGRQ